MQIVQVQLWLATLFNNFTKGSTNIPYGRSPGLFSSSSCPFFCWLQYGVPRGHKPSCRTERRTLGRGSSLESLHSLHKCLNRVICQHSIRPVHRLHIQSTSCSVTPWGRNSPQTFVLSTWVHLGAWIRALFLEGPIISPAFADAHREQVAVTTPSNKFLFSFFLRLALSSWVSS